MLARIKSHRANKANDNSNIETTTNDISSYTINKSSDTYEEPSVSVKKDNLEIPISLEPNTNKINKINNINNDDDFLQSIDFLKSLSKRKQNKINKNNNFPLERNPEQTLEKSLDAPSYGCLKNGNLPTFRELHNQTVKKHTFDTDINSYQNNNHSNSNSKNKKNVTFKYNLGKKHKIVSVLIKNASTRKKISSEHSRLKESKLNDMKNYLKRHNLLKSGSKCPPDVIKKMYEQALLGGDIRNTNKNSIVHNYLAE